MEYRRLGRSGVKVSEISLGSWLTYGGSVAEEQARGYIDRAYELGINFFDTANVYMRGRPRRVSSAIIGASRPEQVEDNARAAGVRLSPDVVSEIDRVLEGVIQR